MGSVVEWACDAILGGTDHDEHEKESLWHGRGIRSRDVHPARRRRRALAPREGHRTRRVRREGEDQHSLSVAEKVIPAIKSENFREGKIRLDGKDLEGIDLRAIWE